MLWTRRFWTATAERTIRTFAQAFLATGVASGIQKGLSDVNWWMVLSIATLAAIVCVATALATLTVSDGPGLTETPKAPAAKP